MEGLPLHPIVVHLPLGGAILALPLLLATWFVVRRLGWSRRTWLLASGLQAMAALGGVVAIQSGEDLAETVEDSVGEAAIEAHEAHAKRFTASLVLGAVASGAAAFAPPPLAVALDVAALLGGAAGLGLAVPAGHSGGEMVWGEPGAGGAISREDSSRAPWGGARGEGREEEDDE